MTFVVIGGGLAGISAALTLQEAGEEVDLYEASDDLGGRVRSDFEDGYIFDRGFQFVNAGYPELKRLEVIGEIDFCKSSRTVDVVTPFGVSSIGDPRLHPWLALRSPLGSIREKISVLTFLGHKGQESISVEEALRNAGSGDFYENLLKPFLRGVFLTELTNVDSSYAREILKSFIIGDSGLPRAGIGALTQALGARVENVHLDSPIDSLAQFEGKKIIVATDSDRTDRLLNTESKIRYASSYNWYHAVPAEMVTSDRLRVTSTSSPLINTIAISNVVSEYAPSGKTLISSTAISSMSDEQAKIEIAKFWEIAPSELAHLKRYEIKAALPMFEPGKASSLSTSLISEKIARAGDYLTSGSQNGALLSGRLAAMELLGQ